ncbi:MAG: biotin--[acetyl-CoA-carboxylase] ligase [Oscillospiraceae bacterium]|jgi:BirA family biotin operon repressor/biotin-[acetyl-CoA-carboxylase] ligase|nr:biotin--[acetyl-CoA-carboxylase] ligase [Oscillospiraceae bacterium]
MTPLSLHALTRCLPSQVSPILCERSGSTNTELSELAVRGAPEYTLLAAAEQTAGRGTRGRAFFAPSGTGAYFSLLLRPGDSNFSAARVTAAAAVAAAEACEALFGVAAGIKWVNDVYVDSRKTVGILAEAFSNSGFYVILGIGANIAPPAGGFPPDLTGAGAMTLSPPPFAREKYIGETVSRFLSFQSPENLPQLLEKYRSRSVLTGRRVTVTASEAEAPYTAEVLGIDDDFRLLVSRGGETEKLFYGEVSLSLEN